MAKKAGLESVGTALTVAAIMFAGAWWLAIQAAKDEVMPIALEVKHLTSIQGTLEKRFDKMDTKIDRIIEILANRK